MRRFALKHTTTSSETVTTASFLNYTGEHQHKLFSTLLGTNSITRSKSRWVSVTYPRKKVITFKKSPAATRSLPCVCEFVTVSAQLVRVGVCTRSAARVMS